MEPSTPEEVFRYCLENPDQLSAEQLLDKFPPYREELRALLDLDRRMVDTLPHAMPDGSREAIRQRLLSSVPNQQPAPPKPSPQRAAWGGKTIAPSSPLPQRKPWARRSAWAFAGVAALVALLWYFSGSALPDSPLYGVKLATEDGLLTFAGGSGGLVRTHVELANVRLYDLRAMQVSGRLAQASPAFSSYSRHLGSGTQTWRDLAEEERANFHELLYVSSVAGWRTFEGFGSAVGSLPAPLQSDITQTLSELQSLNTITSQALQAAGVDLDRLLGEAGPQVGALLTPVPGVALPTPTPPSTPTPMSTATLAPTATAQPTPIGTPLPCGDSYEDDGAPAGARPIAVGETQAHLLCPAGDTDWLVFSAVAGEGYRLETSQLSGGADTTIALFEPDAQTLIASNDYIPGATSVGPSQLHFYPTISGQYYLQVKSQGDLGSPGAGYLVSLMFVGRDATGMP